MLYVVPVYFTSLLANPSGVAQASLREKVPLKAESVYPSVFFGSSQNFQAMCMSVLNCTLKRKKYESDLQEIFLK